MANYSPALDSVFQALADPTRRAVIQRLGRGPASVGELAKPFDMILPSFLKHIGILQKCGLIRTDKVGRVRTCTLEPKNLVQAEKWFESQRDLWAGRYAELDDLLLKLNGAKNAD